MAEVPEFFKYLAREQSGTTLYPFSYDSSEQVFLIADKSLPLDSFDPYDYSHTDLGLSDEGIDIAEVGKHPLYIPDYPGRLIAGPMLHDWVDSDPEPLSETWRVMQDAYRSLHELPEDTPDRSTRTHMGFSAGRREFGGIGVQVMGNCACMGPEVEGVFINGQFEHGFAEYGFHNADDSWQRISLCAGMGHMALLAGKPE